MTSVTHAVIHALRKEQHQEIQESIIKEETLDPSNGDVVKLITNVIKVYSSRANSVHYGTFKAEGEGRGSFPSSYDEYASNNPTSPELFLSLTKTAMDELYSSAEQKTASSGGYMLFAEYYQNEERFFLAAMIKQREGLTLNDDLQPEALMELDLNKLHQAARINFKKYKAYLDTDVTEQQELVYLSFISPRSDKGASGYFVSALGCQSGATSQRATDRLLKATTSFFKDKNQLKDHRREFRKDLITYLEKRNELDELAKLSEIDALARNYFPSEDSEALDALSDEFVSYLNGEENAIPSEFKPSTSVLKRAGQIRGKTSKWKLDFDKTALGKTEGAEIYFDSESNKLTLNNLPFDMIESISEELDSQSASNES